jgi:hypothetical protein
MNRVIEIQLPVRIVFQQRGPVSKVVYDVSLLTPRDLYSPPRVVAKCRPLLSVSRIVDDLVLS